jgi:hypothetical protein
MRIGIDFDNTIAKYDGVFHRAAIERGLIPHDLPPSKNSVRDYLNGSGRKDDFTELQGYVYGSRMDLVSLYSGIAEFLAAARSDGHELFVVSHKTRYPILGPRYDMHAAAQNFLAAQGLIGANGVSAESVFFCEGKDEKVARINELGLSVFVDDLPEILTMPAFPASVRALLFDPDGYHLEARHTRPIERHDSWASIRAALLGG